ncbi:MAG: hypothetical protein P4L74_01065 [Candidatus Doudnabacteria bacterium]|nr:hypothetical protein [Candidatus Doudnabacteria bacterium]
MKNHKLSVVLMAAALLLGYSGTAFASATVTVPLSAGVSSDTATGASMSLPALTLTESAAGDIPVGTLTWALPAGFMLDTSSAANVVYTGTGLAGSAAVSFPDAAHFSVTVSSSSTVAGTMVIGSTTPLKIKVSSGTPLASAGSVLLSAGIINGLSTTTSYGLFSQVPGAANKLAFTVQPPVNVALGQSFGAAVSVEDQFGNVVASDNNRAITLSVSAVSPTSTSGTLSGTQILNDVAGVASFSGLSFNQVGSIALSATSSPLVSALSGNIAVSATSTPTPTPTSTPCTLRNGVLAKVQGSSTVYMVVNCVLRPFTSAAIFHARGKKFQDIFSITSDIFRHLGIGRNIGDGSDNDDTVIVPPAISFSTSTLPGLPALPSLPSLPNLPDGAVIKLPNNPTVYLISGGQLQPFTSSSTFAAIGKKFSEISTVLPEQFNRFKIGSPINAPEKNRRNDH